MKSMNPACEAKAITLAMLTILVASLAPAASRAAQPAARYDCESDLIEVVFSADARVRMDAGGELRDLAAPALTGVSEALSNLAAHSWHRLTHVSEEEVDAIRERGIAKTGAAVPDLNNIYRLRIEGGDVWEVSARLESLPGIRLARPVPKPVAPPTPSAFTQEYRAPAAWNPSGMGHNYFALYFGGDGSGTTICDIEYSWNYDHADISKAAGSQINVDVVNPLTDDHHGTAVAGMLVADDNGWGITGMCPAANFLTCGSYYGNPPSWNPAGAILVAIAHLPPGGVILLEQQWDYDDPGTGGDDLIPIEWYTDTWPSPQSMNPVYDAIQVATANDIYVVEAAGNGSYDLNSLIFAGDSGAIIVGAGGAYPGGTWTEGNLERLSFSTFGFRVNVQGWGEDIVTTGYGDMYQEAGTDDYHYTDTFGGTSGASAHVASAVAVYSSYIAQTSGLVDPTTLRDRFILNGTDQVMGPPGHIGPRPDLMRLFFLTGPPPFVNGGEFGDAPEGVVAYPSSGVVGQFPTVYAPTTPADAMIHSNPSFMLHLGATLDVDYEGNGGLPFLEFFAYDADECHAGAPDDDGLLFPSAYTIQGGTVVPCDATSTELGPACGAAQWGSDIDIEVVNRLDTDAWLNILVDWNQDGAWGGQDNGCGSPVNELVVENVAIPPTGPSPVPLSTLVPGLAPVEIGSEPGYAWARMTLTDAPLPFPQTWTGGLGTGGWGAEPIGETEDYLLRIGELSSGVPGVGGNGTVVLARVFPNPFHAGTAVRFDMARAGDVSMDVFDVGGRLVRRISAGHLAAGSHALRWDGLTLQGERAAAGVYFATIRGASVSGPLRLHVVR